MWAERRVEEVTSLADFRIEYCVFQDWANNCSSLKENPCRSLVESKYKIVEHWVSEYVVLKYIDK